MPRGFTHPDVLWPRGIPGQPPGWSHTEKMVEQVRKGQADGATEGKDWAVVALEKDEALRHPRMAEVLVDLAKIDALRAWRLRWRTQRRHKRILMFHLFLDSDEVEDA